MSGEKGEFVTEYVFCFTKRERERERTANGKFHWGDVGADRGIILKHIFRRQVMI
jgi:hypothetical protein